MDLDKIIDQVTNEYKKEINFCPPEYANFSDLKKNSCVRDEKKYESLPIKELLKIKPRDEELRQEIFSRFKDDIEIYIDDFVQRCPDTNKDKGMQKCYLETWQSCISEIGRNYFNKNKYLRLYDQAHAPGGGGVFAEQYFDDELLAIAVELYEEFCNEYRKQFFIYDCCKFAGMSKDTMYRLNELRGDILKKAHAAQEGSMRTALASGRSNVTAMAILLNHDYDYTRTTQVIHTSSNRNITAKDLPQLEQTQDIVIDQKQGNALNDNNMM